MLAKIHKTPDGQIVVAVCDNNLVGEKFVEGNRQLDVSVSFYGGEELSNEDIGDLMRNARTINLVGEKSIALAIKEGIIDKTNIIRIDGVPHAEAVNAEE